MGKDRLFTGQVIGTKEWVEGYYYECIRNMKAESFIKTLTDTFHVVPESVGQFTGLTDINNVRVFEGSILEFQDKWEWYRAEWWAKVRSCSNPEERAEVQRKYYALPTEKRVVEYDIETGYNFSVSDLKSGYFVVIGNITDNPELIQTKTAW